MKEGIYQSITAPDLGFFRITKCTGHWIVFACTEDGYVNSASSPLTRKRYKDFTFIKNCNETV